MFFFLSGRRCSDGLLAGEGLRPSAMEVVFLGAVPIESLADHRRITDLGAGPAQRLVVLASRVRAWMIPCL